MTSASRLITLLVVSLTGSGCIQRGGLFGDQENTHDLMGDLANAGGAFVLATVTLGQRCDVDGVVVAEPEQHHDLLDYNQVFNITVSELWAPPALQLEDRVFVLTDHTSPQAFPATDNQPVRGIFRVSKVEADEPIVTSTPLLDDVVSVSCAAPSFTDFAYGLSFRKTIDAYLDAGFTEDDVKEAMSEVLTDSPQRDSVMRGVP